MSDKYTLTLADINGSENLRNKGALAGDTIVGGKLSRVFSEESDSTVEGYKLTQEDVDGSANLTSKGAIAGDRIVEGKWVSSEKDNAWTQFKYGFDKAGTLISNTADFLEAKFPVGELVIGGDNGFIDYSSPDELHGEGYSEATPDERREILIRERERALQEEYGQFFEEDEAGLAGGVGGFVGSMADPTSLIPVGGGLKAMALGSAAIGGAFSAAEDLAQTGAVDPVKAGITALASGVLAPATVFGARAAGKGISKTAQATKAAVSKSRDAGASKVVAKAQRVLDDVVAKGDTIDSPAITLKDAGLNPAKVEAALTRTGGKLRVAPTASRAQRALDNTLTRDSTIARQASKGLDTYLGALSTRIGNISQRVKGRLRGYEFKTHVRTQDALKTAEPFLKGMSSLAEPIKNRIGLHLMNGRFDDAVVLMRQQSPETADVFEAAVIPQLKDTGVALKEAGHQLSDVPNYFPRLVKDLKGLEKALGQKETGKIGDALKAFAKTKNTTADKLTQAQRTEVTDLTLRGYRMTTDGGKPKFVQPRKIKIVEPQLQKYYATPEESLSMYLRGSADDIERRAFMGRHNVVDEAGQTDVDRSVGSYITEEINAGRIKPEQEEEMLGLLKSRFIGGNQSAHKGNTALKNLGYMGTIANPLSAMIQLTDNAHSATLYGLRNTVSSMLGEKNIKLVDIGLENMISADIGAPTSKLASALDKMMRGSGFTTVDKLGKETLLNSSLKFAQASVKNPKQFAKFKQKHEAIYGDEFPSLVQSLKDGNVDENVKMFLFNELADVQPIALSEFPQGYLDNPNGRILYMLKSFTLKQYDIVRRNIVQEYKKGNKAEAMKNATLLASYLTVANVGIKSAQDMLLGREVHPEDLKGDALWALLGVFGMNEYTADRYIKRGDIKGALINQITPAVPLISTAFQLGKELPKDDPDLAIALKEIPVVGKLVYNWFGGGAEKHNERAEKKRNQQ